MPELARVSERASALLIADEIWTGLGRTGHLLRTTASGAVPDLVCLGKGLGGGLPISACIGRRDVMQAWSRDAEVVHTSTFSGAPLGCATALATLDTLSREKLPERAADVGARLLERLQSRGLRARGAGLMIGVELGGGAGAASALARELLGRGYLVTTGGTTRETLVLTPPLNVAEPLLERFVDALAECAGALA
jgi:4-aminobutyrate aminotransferase/(S)-3-amino-2-methylpropionate transaminase